MAVGGGWWLVVASGWRLAVGGGWWLAVGGRRLAVGAGCRLVAVGVWRLVVPEQHHNDERESPQSSCSNAPRSEIASYIVPTVQRRCNAMSSSHVKHIPASAVVHAVPSLDRQPRLLPKWG